jgi:hypothetical protein
MALIRCPDCDRKVSDSAVACPECARPIAALGGSLRPAAKTQPRTRRAAPPAAPPTEATADAKAAENADRPPVATFPVTCTACRGDSILLYPRSSESYVCPECEELALARGWGRRVVYQWLPIAIGIVVLLALSALALSRINSGHPHDPVVPHGE